ncbi:MAG: conjugal transfer protein TraB [Acidithiobacillus sp.]|nr:conjugal transfer protein TraB [Acidithiobacillus sp.]
MKRILQVLAPFLSGSVIGALAWPHHIWIAPDALIALPFFVKRNWLAPFLLMFGYHLSTTYGLIRGTVEFFPHAGLFLGIAFWSLSSLAFALPYLAYRWLSRWLSFGKPWLGNLSATIITSAVSTILPPLGIIGWTSPWIGALPAGLVGLGLVLVAVRFPKDKPVDGIAVLASLPILLLIFARSPALLPKDWTAIQTTFPNGISAAGSIPASEKLVPLVMADLKKGAKVILLPETTAGYWYPGTRAAWQPVFHWTATHPNQAVLVGAAAPYHRGLLDALVKISHGHEQILPDRIPVPFSMWHPWQPWQSFRMRVFGNPETATVDHKRVLYLICYEQLLMWPAISDLLGLYPHVPQVLLAPANDWWAVGTDIPTIQKASVEAWGEFLGIPVLRAVNR